LKATELGPVDEKYSSLLTPDLISKVVALVPDEWLEGESSFKTIAHHRKAYADFLATRVKHSSLFVKEATDARKSLV
jgi:hypothetical protein